MTTTKTTKAQIQSQLEEARATIDRQRNEIASLKEEIEKFKKPVSQSSTSAWETIKKSWRRCDAINYYKLADDGPGAMALAMRAKAELEECGKRVYISTSGGYTFIAVKK